jgi:uncharacterized protein (DUF952 family)
MRATFHMVPLEVWAATDPNAPYEASSLATQGFVHCTDGEAELLATANRHYESDTRGFLALTVDLETTGAPWRIDDPAGIYPHIYGPIERAAILGQALVLRDAAGQFTGFGPVEAARRA